MTLEYDFSGIRVQEGALTPVDWNLKIDLVALGKKNIPRADAEKEAGLAYQKMYFWLDTNLPNIITLDVGNEDDLYIANLSSNIMMYCPGNPSDDMIIQLLHSKMTALGSPTLVVGEIHLKGSDTALQYTFDCPDSEYTMPTLTADYCKDGSCKHIVPWWLRDDGFCFEFIRPDNIDLDKMSDEDLFGSIVDPMNEFKAIIAEMSDSHINVVKEPAKIVQIEKWKPKKV
jgi:hypothetical protein